MSPAANDGTKCAPTDLQVRWGTERGWLRVWDPQQRVWLEVEAKHAPRWWLRRAFQAKALEREEGGIPCWSNGDEHQ